MFLAVSPPPEVRLSLVDQLSELSLPGRVVPPSNWHITLRFLDVVDTVTYEKFLAGIQPPRETAFRVGLDGFGSFPKPRKATVLMAEIGEGFRWLASLNEQAEEAAVAAGLLPEERPFHPHLTLSRIRPPVNVESLMAEDLSVSWRCQSLVTFLSVSERRGVRYEPLDSINLIG